MKTKLEMAHEWAIELLRAGDSSDDVISCAWQYADAMQAEADKRGEEEIDKWSDELSNILKLSKFKPLELQPDSKEWQPDWSQAPDGFNWWAMDKSGECYWFSGERRPEISIHIFKPSIRGYADEAPCFNYTGDWRDSLRKRPQ